MATTPIRLALLGAGRIGHVHARNIAANRDVDFAYVCDPDEQRAQELGDEYGVAATASVDQVFEDTSLDAVLIGAPNNAHLPLLARAQEAGLAALCEKPIDTDIAGVQEFAAGLRTDGPPIMIAFNRRFDRNFRSIHDRIAQGEIGQVEQVTIVSRDSTPAPVDYIRTSGGVFRDLSIHDLDLARFFVPDIAEVSAFGTNLFADWIEQEGDFDTATIMLRGRRGELITIINSRRCVFGYDQRLEVFGSEGMLQAENERATTVRLSGARSTNAADLVLPFFPERYGPAYAAELEAFVPVARGESAPSPSYEDGTKALQLADAALESVKSGKAVSVE